MTGNRAPASAADRMRRSRKLRRNGLHRIPVLLHDTKIDGLVKKRLLRPEQRGSRSAIEEALGIFVCRDLGLPEQQS